MKKIISLLLTTCFWLTLFANDPLLTGTPIGSIAVDYATNTPSNTVNLPKNAFDGDLMRVKFDINIERMQKSLNYLSRQMQTKKKLMDKLIQKGFSEESIRQAVKKLEDYHYLDDRLYTKQFIQQNQLKAKRI